ncbi:hypothetical protein BDV06DRAFT_205188 [Aspergillus oleicola]
MRTTFFLRRPTLAPSPSPRTSVAPPRLRPRRCESHSTSPQPPKPDSASHSAPKAESDPPTSSHSFPSSTPRSQPQSSPNPSHPPPLPEAALPSVAAQPALRSLSLRQRIVSGPVGRVGRSYSRFQEKRPYTTQLCSSVVIYLFGDLSAQFFFPPEPEKATRTVDDGKGNKVAMEEREGGGGFAATYDPYRTLRHLVVGIGSSIPSYNWFMFLHNSFNFASKPLSILTKVLVQQAVFTPVFNTYFFSVHSLLSGASLYETYERLKVALPRSIVNSAKFWPVVTAFSFMYVPPQFRNVFSGCIAVGWQTYLSWLNQRAARAVSLEQEQLGEGKGGNGTERASSLVGNGMKA